MRVLRMIVTSTNEHGHREIQFEIKPSVFARLLGRKPKPRTVTCISPWYQYTWYDKAHYHEVSPRMQIQCERVWAQHWRGL